MDYGLMDYLCNMEGCECVLWIVYFACESVYVNCDIVNCVFCFQLKGAQNSVWGVSWIFVGLIEGRRKYCPAIFVVHYRDRRKYGPAIFVGHHRGWRKSGSYFHRPLRPTKIVSRPTIFVGFGDPTNCRLLWSARSSAYYGLWILFK
jgi:hypothetical protein